jgi:activator of 2-hydroxyglutaryl-CoA dehydratase
MCTVFAESEVVSLIADGAPVNEIVMGLNRAIASRILSLVKRTTLQYPDMKIAMSGGVARNAGVVRAISFLMDREVSVPQNPDTVGALGAAMIAKEKFSTKRQAASI